MTVRRKIFFVIALMTGFAMVATYILSRVILEPSSNAQERLRARDISYRPAFRRPDGRASRDDHEPFDPALRSLRPEPPRAVSVEDKKS